MKKEKQVETFYSTKLKIEEKPGIDRYIFFTVTYSYCKTDKTRFYPYAIFENPINELYAKSVVWKKVSGKGKAYIMFDAESHATEEQVAQSIKDAYLSEFGDEIQGLCVELISSNRIPRFILAQLFICALRTEGLSPEYSATSGRLFDMLPRDGKKSIRTALEFEVTPEQVLKANVVSFRPLSGFNNPEEISGARYIIKEYQGYCALHRYKKSDDYPLDKIYIKKGYQSKRQTYSFWREPSSNQGFLHSKDGKMAQLVRDVNEYYGDSIDLAWSIQKVKSLMKWKAKDNKAPLLTFDRPVYISVDSDDLKNSDECMEALKCFCKEFSEFAEQPVMPLNNSLQKPCYLLSLIHEKDYFKNDRYDDYNDKQSSLEMIVQHFTWEEVLEPFFGNKGKAEETKRALFNKLITELRITEDIFNKQISCFDITVQSPLYLGKINKKHINMIQLNPDSTFKYYASDFDVNRVFDIIDDQNFPFSSRLEEWIMGIDAENSFSKQDYFFFQENSPLFAVVFRDERIIPDPHEMLRRQELMAGKNTPQTWIGLLGKFVNTQQSSDNKQKIEYAIAELKVKHLHEKRVKATTVKSILNHNIKGKGSKDLKKELNHFLEERRMSLWSNVRSTNPASSEYAGMGAISPVVFWKDDNDLRQCLYYSSGFSTPMKNVMESSRAVRCITADEGFNEEVVLNFITSTLFGERLTYTPTHPILYTYLNHVEEFLERGYSL